MFLHDTKTGKEMQGDGVFQPMWTEEELAGATSMEVWATDFKDTDEYVEFRLQKKDEVIIKKIAGY
jgi:hypothetical protein